MRYSMCDADAGILPAITLDKRCDAGIFRGVVGDANCQMGVKLGEYGCYCLFKVFRFGIVNRQEYRKGRLVGHIAAILRLVVGLVNLSLCSINMVEFTVSTI